MSELSRYFFLAGGLPFLALGAAHALATPLSLGDRKGLSPTDQALSDRMAESRLRLTKRTDMWLAWVGFNLSHSLGLLLFASFVAIIGRSPASFGQQAAACVPLAALTSAAYFCLAARYWFRTPIIGCALSVALFLASWALLILDRS